MNELGKALRENDDMIMMGGGNPSHIPEIQKLLRSEMLKLCRMRKFETMLGDYDGPKGNLDFRIALSEMLNDKYNWKISENIALTTGSQSAFFSLFNMFGGKNAAGNIKRFYFQLHQNT